MNKWIATILSGVVCLGLGFVVMWLWPNIQKMDIVQSTSDTTFGYIGLTSAAVLFMSLLCVQNGITGGTNWKFIVPYGAGCLGLVVSFAKQYNSGGLVLNSAFVFLMIWGLYVNNMKKKTT